MKKALKLIYRTYEILNKILYKYVTMPIKKSMLSKCGKNVYIAPGGNIQYEKIYVGNNVYIGPNATFVSSKAYIHIDNNVMFGPNVTMITGDHRTDIIGKYMIEIKESEKLKENDQDIIIEEDVWVGANSIILKGVRIGEGSIIAAGSIVTKDVEKYSVYAGVPAQKIKERFTRQQIQNHKKILK